MSLIFNHSRYHAYPQNFFGLGVAQVITNKDVNNMSKYGFSSLSDFPSGYGFEGYMGANKAGGMGASRFFEVTASGSGAMGVNAEATTTISVSTGDLVGELIVSGVGSTTLTMTAEGSVVASLNGVGSTTFTINLNHLAMFVDAYGYAIAQLNVITSGSGTLTGKAICGGSTVDTSGLTPASIWNYQDRTLTALDVEVSGLTVEQANQLNDIANNAGLIPALL